MKLSEIDDADKLVTKDHLEVVIGRLENKIDAKFNEVDRKFEHQRVLLVIAVIGVLGQFLNAWILHFK